MFDRVRRRLAHWLACALFAASALAPLAPAASAQRKDAEPDRASPPIAAACGASTVCRVRSADPGAGNCDGGPPRCGDSSRSAIPPLPRRSALALRCDGRDDDASRPTPRPISPWCSDRSYDNKAAPAVLATRATQSLLPADHAHATWPLDALKDKLRVSSAGQRPLVREGLDPGYPYQCSALTQEADRKRLPNMLNLFAHPVDKNARLVQWCSATMISRQSFVTAAHCVDDEFFDAKVTVGALTQPDEGRAQPKIDWGLSASCVVPQGYKKVGRAVRQARCNRATSGCELDIAVCTLTCNAPAALGEGERVRLSQRVADVRLEPLAKGASTGTSTSTGKGEKERTSLGILVQPPVDGASDGSLRPRPQRPIWLAGYGDNKNLDSQFCFAEANLRRGAQACRAGASVHHAMGVAHAPGGAFGAAGDSGGGVFEDDPDGPWLVGVITQFNPAARATYFVDLRHPLVCDFLHRALAQAGDPDAKSLPPCDPVTGTNASR